MNNQYKPLKVNLNIGDQLTSISCGHVVVELIKFIAYQRLQIPYSYQWLKQVINTKKSRENEEKKDSLQSERHYRVASSALENLDFILKSLLQEISSATIPDEVCIALGGSPMMCKEVYRLFLPTVCHKPQCHSAHIANDQKIHRSVFKTLVTSEKLSQVFYNPLPPTNIFVFIKKKANSQDLVYTNDNFIIASDCRIPKTSKVVVIDFRTSNCDNVLCCNEFQVFGDVCNVKEQVTMEETGEESDYRDIKSTDEIQWYQSSYIVKGFKDCIVNGTSITNQWLQA